MNLWARGAAVYDPVMRACGWQRAQARFGRGLREVLDVGCGTAFLATTLGSGYVGLDLEVAMLVRARGPRVVAGDARRLPFRDRSFQTVISTGFLGILTPGDRAAVLSEMARVCRTEVRVLEPIAGVTRFPTLALSRSPIQLLEFEAAGLDADVGPPVYFGLYAAVVARPALH